MFITAVRKSNSSAKERTGDNKIIREPCPSRQLMKLKDPRIVRVSRAFGGKDRHSKVQTIRGLRDRRVRLSVSTAIQLYDLQDRLGFNQPSKVVDWLLNVAQNDIDELPPLQIPPGGFDQLPKANQTQETHSSLMELNMGNVNENVERFSSYADSEGQNALRAHYMMNNCQHFTREDMNGNNSEIKVKKEQNPYGRKAQVSQISLSSNIPSQSNSYPSFNHWESSYLAYLGSHGFSSQQEELQNPVQYAPQLLLCPSSSTSSTFPTLGIPSSIEDTKQVNPFELQVPSLQNLPLNAFMSSVHTINQTMKSFESSMDTKQQFFWNQS